LELFNLGDMGVNSMLKNRLVFAAVVVVVGVGFAGVVALSKKQGTAAGSVATKPADIKWLEVGGGDQGYKYAVGVTKLEIHKTPLTSTESAIPDGKARMTVHVALKSRTQGAFNVTPSFYIGLPKTSSWDYMTAHDAALNAYAHEGCTEGSPEGKPDYCWNKTEFFVDSTGYTEYTIALTGGGTTDAHISSGHGEGSEVPATLQTKDVMFGYKAFKTDPATDIKVIPWP
jgi:hypothetical protein